jgi:hypothetical protein
VYKAALAAYGNSDWRPDGIIVGRRDAGTSEIHELTCSPPSADENTVIVKCDGIEIGRVDVESTDSADAFATALKAAINTSTEHPFEAVDGSTTADVDLESQYGANTYTITYETEGAGDADLVITEKTAAVPSAETVQDALDAIRNERKDWYGLALVTKIKGEVESAAAWAETRPIFAHFRVNDAAGDGALDGTSTTDLAYSMGNSAYGRSLVFFYNRPWKFPEVATLAQRLATDPDENSTQWALLTLNGFPTDDLDSDEQTSLTDKNCNFYVEKGGRGTLLEGVTSAGEHADITLYSDWFKMRLQERVFGRLSDAVNAGSKVPFDDGGGTILESELRGQFRDAAVIGHISATPEPEITNVDRADISEAVVGTREWPAIQGSAQWANAIKRAKFTVTLTN